MKIINLRSVLLVIILLGLVFAPQEPVLAQVAKAGVFEDIKVQPGAQFELPVEVRGVENLYAVDIEIRFDPAILQAEDADPNMEGVQAGLSTFLEAGLLLYNTIDNQEGVLRFAMSQVNPAEPVSGDGILLVVYFLARAEGKTELRSVWKPPTVTAWRSCWARTAGDGFPGGTDYQRHLNSHPGPGFGHPDSYPGTDRNPHPGAHRNPHRAAG